MTVGNYGYEKWSDYSLKKLPRIKSVIIDFRHLVVKKVTEVTV